MGQSDSSARFIANSHGYSVKLDTTGARFQFKSKDVGVPAAIGMDLVKANHRAVLTGEDILPGRADYFPSGDKKTWITNVPTYSRVHYSSVYPGVDVSFYGTSNRLEYDFLIQAGFHPGVVRMKISGADHAELNAAGDLVLRGGKGELRFLKPLAYQFASDGKTRQKVEAAYRMENDEDGEPVVSFAVGQYDHTRKLVIDPVVDALSYSEYINQYYVGAVTVDAAGNAYVTGQGYPTGYAFYVNKFSSAGVQLYSASFGTGNNGFPYAIAVDSSGDAYVTGQVYTSNTTVPATSGAYQGTPGSADAEAFVAVLSSTGTSTTYCSYLSGNDTQETNSIGVAIDSSKNIYIGGSTYSASFPVTSGAYQQVNPSHEQIGWVAKLNPSASGAASLVYATYLGSTTSSGTDGQQVNRIAVDYAGNAYIAAQGGPGYPLTAGAFTYTGYESANGGAFVTKLNSTGTGLVYSAYLGYGGASGIAIDTVTSGSPSAYVSGWIDGGGEDFPTTPGAYQTSYASGFAVKLSGDGSTELYSTFLSGPSGYTTEAVDHYPTIAVPVGCAANCNASVAGRTYSSDWPLTNPIQSTPPNTPYSAFITELNATGAAALFSTYFSGSATEVYRTNDSQSYGVTPAVAVDGSGNIYLAANATGYSNSGDLPTTIPYPTGSQEGFLVRINAAATAGYTLAYPTSIAFGTVEVGTTSAISTIRLSNYGGTAITGLTTVASPGSVFAESDTCNGTIPAGGTCTLDVTFTPNTPSTRSGALTITSSASNSPTTVTLTGTGSDGEYAAPSVSSLTFSDQAVGTASAAQTFTITNYGDESTPSNIYTNAPQFVALNNCPPQLPAGASCSVSVTFTPTQPGLYQNTLTIQLPGIPGPNFTVSLTGTGVVSGATTALTPNVSSLQFGTQTAGTTSGQESYVYTNTGTEPIVINSVVASGPFNISYLQYNTPFQLNPQGSFQVNVTFSPTTAGTATGSVAVNSSVSSSPTLVSLTGAGQASSQTVEFYPSTSVTFPDTPQGSISGIETIYLENTGTSPMTIDRTYASSGFHITYDSCQATTINGASPDGLGSAGACQVNVEFTPSASASGLQSGTLTFVNSASNSPQVVNLSGNAITATGTIGVSPSALPFTSQTQGITSAVQYLYVQNPGNTPVTVTGVSFTGTNGSDFTTTGSNCGGLPYTLAAQQFNCYFTVEFTPGGSGSRTGTFTVTTSAGNAMATLTGIGVAASQAIELIPTSLNLGSIVNGQRGSSEGIFVYNAGTETASFTNNPTITGANAADFTLNGGCANSGNTLTPGSSCELSVSFGPTTSASESATLTFTDSAGTQTFALSGTGVAATPTYTTEYHAFSFTGQVVGTTFPTQYYTYFYNNGSTAVTLGNATVTGSFLIPHGYDSCSGQTVAANGGRCYVYVTFAPTAAGYQTGTLTFESSGGTPLTGAPVLPLTGYGVAESYSASLNPTAVNFTALQVIGTTTSYTTSYLYNTGNTAFNVGTVSGTDLGLAGASAEFSLASANGGTDACSNTTVQPGGYCYVRITFTPNAAGTRSGTINFPVTYANSSTATITGTLKGFGVAERNSAVLTPSAGAFIDQIVGNTTTYNVTTYLNNNGNQPFNVASITNADATEFSTASSAGGYDSCSGATIQVGGYCQVNVRFTPSTTGTRTGSIGFPVTFADHTTATPALSLTGNGISSAKTVSISASSLNFGTEIQGITTRALGLTVYNTGNSPITVGSDSISTNSSEFSISSDGCRNSAIGVNGYCNINVTFTPSSSATGAQSGVLTIGDNATGGPHTVPLTGIAITAAQQIVVSPSTLAFGNQPTGSTSSTQIIYITNQGDNTITNTGITLGGTNAGYFAIASNQCGNFGGHSTCYVTVDFAPPASASGALTATITETDSGTPGTHTVTLTGNAIAPGPAATLNPSTLAFPRQNVGSVSAAQAFSVTNTGSASLVITAVASTNPTEFPVYVDGCSGTTLAAGAHCVASVQFAPSLGGTRSGSITVTDNASGSPQSVAVSGLGYGIPSTTYTPASLTFGNTKINSSSATQSITLKNPGTDTLDISGIAITGLNASEFTQTNTCGATLVPSASCLITVTFKPTAAGAQGAYVTVTDNANNIGGATQSTPLSGTGVAVPTGTVSPGSLSFPSTDIGVASSALDIQVTNSGTGPLTIASIAIGGANAGDYSQSSNCGSTLENGSSCTIAVVFKPTASGTRTATVTITDNANGTSGATQTVSISGTGAGLPSAALSAPSITFTDQNVGSSSSAQSVTLSNSGTGALTIASIAIGGADASDFATTNNCSGAVAAGSSCAISVTFKPTAPGTRTATLTITDNAGNAAGSMQTVALSGTGIGVPYASVTPPSLTFATTVIGTTTAAQTVTVSNSTGTGPLSITQIVIGGTNAGDFSDTTTCGATLAAGSTCSISVTFTPTAAGSRTANLHVIDNSGNTGSTQNVTLSGTGTAGGGAPSAALSPSSLTFQTQTDGTTSAAQTLTLANSGNAPLSIASIALGGTDPGDFADTTTCGSSLAAAANCSISVTFKPTAAGSRSATVTVTDNAGNVAGSTQTAMLSGTGTTSTTPAVVSLSPASGTGLTKTFTAVYSDPDGLSNLGTAKLLFNTSISGVNACDIYYSVGTNALYLYNNAGQTVYGPLTPGSSSSISNSQCTLAGTGTSVTTSGNTLTINFAITFQSAFSGSKNVYMEAISSSGSVSSGWTQEGTWTPATAGPAVVSLSPATGTGLTQTFTAVYSDSNGLSDLGTAKLLFNTAISGVSACDIYYTVSTNSFYLYNNADNGQAGPLTPGSSSSISNSQCTLAGTGTSVTTSGNTLTINFAITFGSTFTGSKNVYMEAISSSGSVSSGWTQEGTWTP